MGNLNAGAVLEQIARVMTFIYMGGLVALVFLIIAGFVAIFGANKIKIRIIILIFTWLSLIFWAPTLCLLFTLTYTPADRILEALKDGLALIPVAVAIVLLVKCHRRRLAEKKDETQSKTGI